MVSVPTIRASMRDAVANGGIDAVVVDDSVVADTAAVADAFVDGA